MNSPEHSSQENKTPFIANAHSQEQTGNKSPVQFVDNRPETIKQRKLQEIANNSPQAIQLRAIQAMADSFSKSQKDSIQKKENNTGLPDSLKSGIENLSGYSMDDVKVHYDSNKPAQLHAHAYAQGTDIHLASGQEQHLPHEAWHVVQQKQGRVKPTMQMKGGVNVNDDKGLEHEADVMGEKAIQFQKHIGKSSDIQSNEDTNSEINKGFQGFIIDNRTIQPRWVNDGGWKWVEEEWNARLMYKAPPREETPMPKVLKWDGGKYTPSAVSFEARVFPVSDEQAQNLLGNLRQWHQWAVGCRLNDSSQILSQIIDVIGSKERGVQLLSVWNGNWLRGVSLYEFNGTTEGYPEIPEQESHYVYVMFSAAHPATQLPSSLRGVGNDGGVGSALNAEYNNLMQATKFPIFRHAANPNSYLSLLRAGYQDVNAETDGFTLPQ